MQFPFLRSYSNCFVPTRDWSPLAKFQIHACSNYSASSTYYLILFHSQSEGFLLGNATLMLVLIILSILTIRSFCFSVARRLVGNVQIHFELIILLPMFILTCIPKGTGAFWGNPDSLSNYNDCSN